MDSKYWHVYKSVVLCTKIGRCELYEQISTFTTTVPIWRIGSNNPKLVEGWKYFASRKPHRYLKGTQHSPHRLQLACKSTRGWPRFLTDLWFAHHHPRPEPASSQSPEPCQGLAGSLFTEKCQHVTVKSRWNQGEKVTLRSLLFIFPVWKDVLNSERCLTCDHHDFGKHSLVGCFRLKTNKHTVTEKPFRDKYSAVITVCGVR